MSLSKIKGSKVTMLLQRLNLCSTVHLVSQRQRFLLLTRLLKQGKDDRSATLSYPQFTLCTSNHIYPAAWLTKNYNNHQLQMFKEKKEKKTTRESCLSLVTVLL